MTQPWPLLRLRLDSRAEKRVSARALGPLRPLVPPVPVRYNEGQMHAARYIDNDLEYPTAYLWKRLRGQGP